MTFARDLMWYTTRPGHTVIHQLKDAPPHTDDGSSYLYLCVFPDRLKIGVSCDPYVRLVQHHTKTKAKIEHCYLINLPRAEALRRERIIALTFGYYRDTRQAPHAHEWFGREELPYVVLVMREPELSASIKILRQAKADFERYYFDPRFESDRPAQRLREAA